MTAFNQQILALVNQKKYEDAITIAETKLSAFPKTNYQKIIGRDLLHLVEETGAFISAFYEVAKKEITIKAMYFEMNGFGVNTDLWYFQGFAFSFCGDSLEDDHSWLADYEFGWHEYAATITGFEDLQKLYKDHLAKKLYKNELERDSKFYSEEIVTLRFLELFKHTVAFAKKNNLPWRDIPVFATSHDHGCLFKSV